MCQWLTSVKFGHTKWLCLFTNEMNKNLSSFFCVLAFLLRKLVDCKKWVCWEVRFWLNQNWFGKNDATSVFSVRVNIILFLTSVCIFRISRTTSIFSYNLLSASNPTQPNLSCHHRCTLCWKCEIVLHNEKGRSWDFGCLAWHFKMAPFYVIKKYILTKKYSNK